MIIGARHSNVIGLWYILVHTKGNEWRGDKVGEGRERKKERNKGRNIFIM